MSTNVQNGLTSFLKKIFRHTLLQTIGNHLNNQFNRVLGPTRLKKDIIKKLFKRGKTRHKKGPKRASEIKFFSKSDRLQMLDNNKKWFKSSAQRWDFLKTRWERPYVFLRGRNKNFIHSF